MTTCRSANTTDWLWVHFRDCDWIVLWCNVLALTRLPLFCLARKCRGMASVSWSVEKEHPLCCLWNRITCHFPTLPVSNVCSESQLHSPLAAHNRLLSRVSPTASLCWLCTQTCLSDGSSASLAVILWHLCALWTHSCPASWPGGLGVF